MRYFLARDAVLKWIEKPSVYHIGKDDLYELDSDSFEFLNNCATESGCNVKKDEFIDYCLKEGILTEDKVSVKRPLLIKSPDPSLRYLELQITNKCNLKCKHCYIGDVNIFTFPQPLPSREGKSKEIPLINSPLPLQERSESTRTEARVRGRKNFSELSIEQIKNILKEFEKMQGLRVLITGGEPLIHRGFKEINEMLPEFFVRKVLFTNGLLLDKKVLKKLNVDEIQISVDGLEEAHDFLRGKGTFRSAIGAVKRAIDSGFEVSISTMVHAKNLEDFDKMERLFQGLGIKDWTVDIPCITGRLQENPEFQISPEQGGKYLRYGYGNGLHAGVSGFACGLHLMAVTADGRVSKCTFYSDSSVGRIEDGLRECWQRIRPIKLNELKCDCMHIESCRGGCRYRAQLLGDPYGKDLYKCKFYDIIKIDN
jgi:radical SAM protein with 4Fe4S-binding SPASM domain